MQHSFDRVAGEKARRNVEGDGDGPTSRPCPEFLLRMLVIATMVASCRDFQGRPIASGANGSDGGSLSGSSHGGGMFDRAVLDSGLDGIKTIAVGTGADALDGAGRTTNGGPTVADGASSAPGSPGAGTNPGGLVGGSGGMPASGGTTGSGGAGPTATGVNATSGSGVANAGGETIGRSGGSGSGGQVGTGGAPQFNSGSGGSGSGGRMGTGGAPSINGSGGSGSGGATVDPCVNNGGCDINATCQASAGTRVCKCKPGYVGDGAACADVNECLANNGGCDVNATCTNTAGGKSCACKAGFTGDGSTCTDVNECLANNGGCDVNATCTNTAGGKSCACKAGFTGDGSTCADVNECLVANGGCSVNATCVNTVGARTCSCKVGYSGDGLTCSDINECATGNGGCDTNATCTNTSGGRTCACKSGFSGDGLTCNDINECLTGNGGCNANATCTNTTGGRTCKCGAGFTGDGLTCSLIPPPAPIDQWKFELQSQPSTILDSAGANNGNVVSTNALSPPPIANPTFTTDRNGRANGALSLIAPAQNWVLVPNSSSLDIPWEKGAITVTAWVRMHTVPASGGVVIFDRGTISDPTGIELQLFNGAPYVSVALYEASSASPMPVGKWTFLCLTYDGISLYLYVDGVQAGSFENINVPLARGVAVLAMGAGLNTRDGYSGGNLDGDLDEIRIYSAALTAAQVKSVMQE